MRLLLFFLLCSYSVFAQKYPLGLNPDSQQWKQIKTDSVHIIFPEGTEKQANRVANLVQTLYGRTSSIGEKQKRVSLILHNRTSVSNGFVTLSPFRSEFYLTPPQEGFLGTGNWLDLLTIHEYRHIQQYLNAKRGITKVVSWVFGQNGWALMRAVSLPRWFMEGDAVCQETAFSPTGRGRLPLFDMEYRTLRLSQKQYGYEKASAGSYRNFVPNHYNLGYYLTSYARNHYGNEVWKNVVKDASNYRGIFYPLSQSLRRQTGMYTPKMYRTAMLELDSIWKAEDSKLQLSEFQVINTNKKRKFTSYQFPQFLNDTSLVVIKTGFDIIPTFYKISLSGKEESLFPAGINLSPNLTLSASQNQITWTENTFDVRWGNQDYSIIKTYHLLNHQKKKISSKSKFFAPSLSSDANKIVTVEYNELQECSLVILDSFNGNILQKISNADGYYFSFPKWLNDNYLVVVGQKNQQHYLLKVEISSGKTEILLEGGFAQMLTPAVHQEYVFFSWALTGIQNIFAVNLNDKSVYQVTSSRFGAFQPAVSPNGKHLAYSNFTAMGYDLALVPIQTNTWKKIETNYQLLPKDWLVELRKRAGTGGVLTQYTQTLTHQEKSVSFLDSIPDRKYEVRKFPKTSGLINIHSLQPFISPPTFDIQLQSNNKFSTLAVVAGYQHNFNENNGIFYGNIVYGQFFPVFEAGVIGGRNRTATTLYLDKVNIDTVNNKFTDKPLGELKKYWDETSYYAGITLPFNLSSSSYFSNLRMSGKFYHVNYQYTKFETSYPNTFDEPIHKDGDFNAVDFRLRFVRQQWMATQYLRPRFAQIVDVWYRKNISDSKIGGTSLNALASLYLPSIFRTHSLALTSALSRRGFTDQYQFPDTFFYPRGFGSFSHDKISKTSIEYAFPLFYPDLTILSFAFIKRVYVNGFYDQAQIVRNEFNLSKIPDLSNYGIQNLNAFSVPKNSFKASSFGAEVLFDVRWFRLLESRLGVRCSYRNDYQFFGYTKPVLFEMVIVSLGN
jgi:hypothetical protein